MKTSNKSSKMTSLLHCCNWILSIKLSRIILTVLLLLVMIPVLVHYYLSKIERDNSTISHRPNMKYDLPKDFSLLRASDLKMRIEEMLRIKASVSNELRNLEEKSKKIQLEISGYHQRIDSLKSDLSKEETELNKLKTSLRQAQLSRQEALQHNTPELALPLPLFPNDIPQVHPEVNEVQKCHKMFKCFDYSRCSITSGFPVYLYDPDEYLLSWNLSIDLKTLVKQTIGYNPHFTDDPKKACVYVVLVGGTNMHNLEELKKLPYWAGDGRNHIILNLSRKNSSASAVRITKDLGRSIIAQSFWWSSDLRANHDIVIPPILGPPGGEVWQDMPYMLPARRKYILSFQGSKKTSEIHDGSFDVRSTEKYLTRDRSDDFYLRFGCPVLETGAAVFEEEWQLCDTEVERAIILKDSTFVLIPGEDIATSTPIIQTRLLEALKYGSIPVVIGGDGIEFPFSEKLDWNKVLISIPTSRVTECHWLIRSFSDDDLLLMRRQGRLVYERYFSTAQNLLDTVLTLVRDRIGIPPPPIPDYPAPSVFPEDFKPLRSTPVDVDSEPEENLGPLEAPFSSQKYARNYSVIRTQGYEMWNEWGDPFRLYPQLPFDPVLSSDAKFMGSGFGFRVINGGAGGAGKEFCESLGGNWRKEQFTIVILTYEREQVLMNSISRLNGLPYLNKVIVVWNSPNPPLQDLRWPDIGAPVQVVSVRKNSLNNRFLPFEAIETEAVLSVDDDAHMRHDEIIFGFRVWREQRDRIVGFPGRFHALDLNHGGWLYNSNYSCELSMVLTGAAFVHKYYLYLYTYWLPQGIRDMVDQYMNCEDIAMNFLVSHVTRKPPVKVTSRWTFRCPGCPVILSEDESHFNERHHCINYFSKVFGYTPLLNTQFRADSVLFKTRISHDKQKCFKFI